jgi:hypothetical protein
VLNSVEIKYCGYEDIERLQQFFDSHWNRGHILARNEALLKWQFKNRQNERSDSQGLSVLIACENGRIIAILGLILCDYNIKGKVVPAVWLSHWLSVPEVRTRGIGLELMRKVQNSGYEAILGLGINERVRRLYTLMRFEVLSAVPRWVGVCDIDKTVGLLKEVNPELDLDDLHRHCRTFSVDLQKEFSGGEKVSIIEWSKDLEGDWDRSWSSYFASGLICTNKDSSYITWRYIDHPIFKYDVRVAKSSGTQEIIGLMVFRIEKIKKREEKILRIVEFISLPEAETPLANTIVEVVRDLDISFADFFCTYKKMKNGLEAHGFRWHQPQDDFVDFPSLFQPLEHSGSKLQGVFQFSRPLQDELGELSSSDEFYVTRSDGDQDRPN